MKNLKFTRIAKNIFGIAFFSFAILFNSCAKSEGFDGKTVSNKFKFIDSSGAQHETRLYKKVERHDFNAEDFIPQGSRMEYVGEGYTSKQGIDISQHDGEVDWQKVKEWGVEFVILRVGYMGYQSGKLNLDKKFHQNIKDALEAGLEVGVYFFAQAVNEKEAVEEAQFVLEQIKDYQITLPVVYDPESILNDRARTDKVSRRQFTKNALAFCKTIQEAGYTPMIYMNILWQANKLFLDKLDGLQFWYAGYEKFPETPYRFTFWQYSCMGVVDGIEVPEGKECLVDMDIWLIKNE